MEVATMKNSPSHRRTRSGSGVLLELRKPKTLNALDLDDFLEIERALNEAERDSNVRFLAIWAPVDASPRAFCAGGDVRRLHEEYCRSGTLDHGSRFFQTEYRVDHRIWTFSKPVIALTHGITMGGGIGLIHGATIRVACDSSVWAMPEISIGLYPDVGATYFFSLLPETWAAFMALTGAKLGIADILQLGLATHGCRQEDLPRIIEELEELEELTFDSAKTVEAILRATQRATSSPEASRLAATRSWSHDWTAIESVFGALALDREEQAATATALWQNARRLRDDSSTGSELRGALDTMLSGSPASVRLILEQLRISRALRGRGPEALQSAFLWEYSASMNCMEHGDFFEGVRSRLVDKDFREPGCPRWSHRSPDELAVSEISALFPTRVPG
jgi:enoyl-CoA hydratase/carnithine racemase